MWVKSNEANGTSHFRALKPLPRGWKCGYRTSSSPLIERLHTASGRGLQSPIRQFGQSHRYYSDEIKAILAAKWVISADDSSEQGCFPHSLWILADHDLGVFGLRVNESNRSGCHGIGERKAFLLPPKS